MGTKKVFSYALVMGLMLLNVLFTSNLESE